MKIGLVTTTRDSPETIQRFITHYHGIGVERLYVFLDDPSSQAASKDPAIKITRCTTPYWDQMRHEVRDGRLKALSRSSRFKGLKDLVLPSRLQVNASLALSWAREEGLDWLINVDGDELLYTQDRTLAEVLADTPRDVDVLTFGTLEAIPSKLDCKNPFAEIDQFKHAWRPRRLKGEHAHRNMSRILQWQARAIKALGCKRALFEGEYFRGHNFGKSVIRVDSPYEYLGNHWPITAEPLDLNFARKAWVLHYDCYSYDEWCRKWSIRDKAVNSPLRLRSNREHQHEAYKAMVAKGDYAGLRRLYKRLHCIPASEQFRLRAIGLLKTIHLNPRDK